MTEHPVSGVVSRLAAAWSRLRGVIRLSPYDTNTEAGRAQERHRRVALSALASALAKIISVSTALISVPLTLHYLGPERYGLWMTISSLVAILAFADLGIGNGLLNAIAAAHGRDDRAAIRRDVSSGFCVLSAVALGMLVLFALAYPFVPWPTLFNVKTALAQQEVGPAVAVFVACFTLAIPVSIVQRVQMGLQRGFLASLWQCVSSLMGLVGVVIAIRQQAGLPWLVLAFMGAPLIASAVNSLLFFGRTEPLLAPGRAGVSKDAALHLLRAGGLFLVLQLVAAVAYASDNFIIAHLLGAPAVADYAVPERMFSFVTMVLAMVLAPLWPAYGEAIARGDAAWVRRTLRRSVTTAVAVSGVFSFTLVWIGPWLIDAWVGNAVTTSALLLLGLATWKTFEAGATALAAFLNGANIVRTQVAVSTATMILAVALKFMLVPRVGVAGVVWATAIAFGLCAAIPYCLLLPAILRGVASRDVNRSPLLDHE
jgi:O-antigen/teichoic acid export membrane protein